MKRLPLAGTQRGLAALDVMRVPLVTGTCSAASVAVTAKSEATLKAASPRTLPVSSHQAPVPGAGPSSNTASDG